MSYPNCHYPRDQGEKHRCCVDSSIFQWRLHFLQLFSQRAYNKTGGFALYCEFVAAGKCTDGLQKIDTKPLYCRQTFDKQILEQFSKVETIKVFFRRGNIAYIYKVSKAHNLILNLHVATATQDTLHRRIKLFL
jgi:hypothetical protein